MRAIGIILAGGNNNRMRELSDKRAIAAMPIAGSYRSIDFALSNMANSRIQKVAVLTQYNARSLNEHLSSSKWWDFVKKQDRAHGQKEGKSPPHRAVFFLHPTASCRQGPPACGRLLPKPLYKLYSTRRPGELQSSIPHAILL